MTSFYDNFHLKSKFQTKLISRRDFTYRNLLKFLNRYTDKNLKILDVGCGVGTIDLYLGNLGNNIFGIDISTAAIEFARESARKLKLEDAVNFKTIDFPEVKLKGKFDLIICSEVLEHIPNDMLAIKELSRLLKPKGIVIVSVPSSNAPLFRLGMLKQFDEKVGHLRRYSKTDLINLFVTSGLKILEIKEVEGILRNILFTSYFGGILLKILKRFPFSFAVTFIDDVLVSIIGGSDLYLIAQKR